MSEVGPTGQAQVLPLPSDRSTLATNSAEPFRASSQPGPRSPDKAALQMASAAVHMRPTTPDLLAPEPKPAAATSPPVTDAAEAPATAPPAAAKPARPAIVNSPHPFFPSGKQPPDARNAAINGNKAAAGPGQRPSGSQYSRETPLDRVRRSSVPGEACTSSQPAVNGRINSAAAFPSPAAQRPDTPEAQLLGFDAGAAADGAALPGAIGGPPSTQAHQEANLAPTRSSKRLQHRAVQEIYQARRSMDGAYSRHSSGSGNGEHTIYPHTFHKERCWLCQNPDPLSLQSHSSDQQRRMTCPKCTTTYLMLKDHGVGYWDVFVLGRWRLLPLSGDEALLFERLKSEGEKIATIAQTIDLNRLQPLDSPDSGPQYSGDSPSMYAGVTPRPRGAPIIKGPGYHKPLTPRGGGRAGKPPLPPPPSPHLSSRRHSASLRLSEARQSSEDLETADWRLGGSVTADDADMDDDMDDAEGALTNGVPARRTRVRTRAVVAKRSQPELRTCRACGFDIPVVKFNRKAIPRKARRLPYGYVDNLSHTCIKCMDTVAMLVQHERSVAERQRLEGMEADVTTAMALVAWASRTKFVPDQLDLINTANRKVALSALSLDTDDNGDYMERRTTGDSAAQDDLDSSDEENDASREESSSGSEGGCGATRTGAGPSGTRNAADPAMDEAAAILLDLMSAPVASKGGASARDGDRSAPSTPARRGSRGRPSGAAQRSRRA